MESLVQVARRVLVGLDGWLIAEAVERQRLIERERRADLEAEVIVEELRDRQGRRAVDVARPRQQGLRRVEAAEVDLVEVDRVVLIEHGDGADHAGTEAVVGVAADQRKQADLAARRRRRVDRRIALGRIRRGGATQRGDREDRETLQAAT